MNRPIDIRRRVQRGARLLDRLRPRWFKRVSLKKLDMREGRDCVLGQLYGNFLQGMTRIGLEDDFRARPLSVSHGFDDWTASIYSPLTEEWTRAIQLRRKREKRGTITA